MTVAFRAKSTSAAYSTGNPGVTLPAGIQAGDGIYILVGSKPDTAGPADATGYTNIGAFTGGTGSTGIDTGPTRIGVLFREADGSEGGTTVTVTVPSNNVSWAYGWVLSRTLGAWDNALIGGDDTTGASAAYSATSTADVGVAAGDYIIAACCIPTDACTVAVDGALTNNLTRTSTTFGTAQASGNLESASGQDIGGHVRGVPVSTASGTANLVYTVTFTGSTNTYGPTVFIRARDVAAPIARTVNDNSGTTDAGVSEATSATGTDPAGVTDSVSAVKQTEFPRSQTDLAGLVDTAAATAAHGRTATDQAGLVDTAAPAAVYARTVDDLTGTVDAATPAAGHARSQTDNAAPTDAAQPAIGFGRTVDDNAAPTDSASTQLTGAGPLTRTVDDPAGLVDTTARAAEFARTVDDGSGVTDAGIVQGLGAAGTDGAGVTDTVSTQLSTTSITRTVTDDAGATDQGDPLTLDVAETIDNPAGLTDSVTQQSTGAGSFTRTVDDLAGVSDARAVAQTATVADNSGSTDIAAGVVAHNRAITDTAGATDAAGQASAGAGTRQVTDTAGPTDAVTYSSTQTLADTLGPVDAVTLAVAAARTAADVLGLTDTVTVALTRSVTVTDSAGVTDSASAVVSLGNAYTRFVTDSAGLSSNHQVRLRTHRPFTTTTSRPTAGTTSRPYAGVTSRFPFVPD